jgi:2-polyprenyl-3-methyl-5-hydroxy-6-metoxy-1,4-benzoquinol methylase
MNYYDMNKRLEVVYNELLIEDIKGKKILDAGCGTGWFSKTACERGAIVTSLDVGENLLSKVKEKCNSECVVGSVLGLPFQNNFFDILVSSEVIEHTPNPLKAIDEFHRVLKPGGILVLTTPNRFWYFSLLIANRFKLRPYQGLENWVGYKQLQKKLTDTGFQIKEYYGIHLFPFIFLSTNSLLDFFHKFRKTTGPVMLNIATKCVKKA